MKPLKEKISITIDEDVLKELKQSHIFKTEKRRGLTKQEQELLLDFL